MNLTQKTQHIIHIQIPILFGGFSKGHTDTIKCIGGRHKFPSMKKGKKDLEPAQ